MAGQQLLRALGRRIKAVAARAVLTAIDDSQALQALQVRLNALELRGNVPALTPYGLAHYPLEGAEAVVLAPEGDPERSVVIVCHDRRYRLTGLEAGEVALHDDSGSKVHLRRDGKIDISCSQRVRIEAPLVEIAQDLIVRGDVMAQGEVFAAGAKEEADAPTVGLFAHQHSETQSVTAPPTPAGDPIPEASDD